MSAAHAVRQPRMASNVLHRADGTLADERDGHRVGKHAVARDAAGGVGGVDEGRDRKSALIQLLALEASVLAWHQMA
jgi:hypothetical protein